MDFGVNPTRRAFLRSTAIAGAGIALPTVAGAQAVPKYGKTEYSYEVVRTEAEWRERLDTHEFNVLREGGTELPKTSEMWDDYSDGQYYCRGCDLHLYDSEWRAPVKLGWVFFYHSVIDAVLPGLDTGSPYSQNAVMGSPENPERTLIEVHCRRCGSHMGHIVHVGGKLVHCINGASLVFQAAEA